MTVRKILCAPAGRPHVEALLDALVGAAVFIGSADGRLGEEELDAFIDGMREVVSSAVGSEFVTSVASTPKLLDRAKAARRSLVQKGPDAFLAQLGSAFPSLFAREGLVLAYRIVLADGRVTDTEAAAFARLCASVGVGSDEAGVLIELATQAENASRHGHQATSIELLDALTKSGWVKHRGEHFDAGLMFTRPDGHRVALELDASESALHVYLESPTGTPAGPEPHVLCFFGGSAGSLGALLAALDGMKMTLTSATLAEKLPALRGACGSVFVEHDGRFAQP